jgi:lipopolysaccharide export system permease protein
MTKIFFYMFRKYLIGFTLAISILLSINLLIIFLSELKNIGINQYDLIVLFKYIIYLIPQNILDIFPYALLIGSMIAFGSMSFYSEIVALNSMGIGIKKTISIILFQTLLIAMIASFSGNYFASDSAIHAQNIKNTALKKNTANKEVWFKGKNTIINVKNVITEYNLKNIEIYYIDNGIMSSILTADKGAYNKEWNLESIKIIDINNNKIINKKSLTVSSDDFIPLQVLKSSFHKIRYHSIQDLYTNIAYFDERGIYYEDHKIAFWQKIFLPFSCCIIVFIGLPFLFTKARSTNQSQRIIYGILFGITYFVMSSIIINASLILHIPALLSVLISMSIFIMVGLLLFNRLVKTNIPI